MASKTVIRSIQVSASFIAFGELPSLDTASFIVCLKDKFRSKRFPLLLKPSSRSNFVFNGFDYIRTTISACSSDSLSWEPIKHETKSGCLELGDSPTFWEPETWILEIWPQLFKSSMFNEGTSSSVIWFLKKLCNHYQIRAQTKTWILQTHFEFAYFSFVVIHMELKR